MNFKHSRETRPTSSEAHLRDDLNASSRRLIETLRQEPPADAETYNGLPDYNIVQARVIETAKFTGAVALSQRSDASINPEYYVGEETEVRVLGVNDKGSVIDFNSGSLYSRLPSVDDLSALRTVIAELAPPAPAN